MEGDSSWNNLYRKFGEHKRYDGGVGLSAVSEPSLFHDKGLWQ